MRRLAQNFYWVGTLCVGFRVRAVDDRGPAKPSLDDLTLFFALFYVYAMVGMELFSGKLDESNNQPGFRNTSYYQNSFTYYKPANLNEGESAGGDGDRSVFVRSYVRGFNFDDMIIVNQGTDGQI